MSIKVTNLKRDFITYKKDPGLKGSIKALFKREHSIFSAVKNISFEIEQGELVGFIGQNGAGKTTTLKMLSGLLYPTSGDLSVLGYKPYERKKEFLKSISLVMGQKNQLWTDLPAIETFLLNKDIYEINDKEYNEIFNDLTEMFDLKDIVHTQVRKLSLGQRMRCEFIAALLHKPKILFLDEPTIGLDVIVQKKVREFVKEYNKKYGATVILTSHYMDDVKELCNRIIMVNEGEIVYDGLTNDLIKQHAFYKNIEILPNTPISKEEISEFGTLLEYSKEKITLKVPRSEVSSKASSILSTFDIDDLNINEPKLEDIVSQMYERKSS